MAIGENHVIVLTADSSVYAWGNNQNGQCGVGSPIATFASPQLVTALSGVGVKQISAGTTHSMVWCSAPPDGIGFSQQKPFALDIHPKTFSSLRSLLEKYEPMGKAIAPFADKEQQEQVFFQTIQILKSHLHVAKVAQMNADETLGAEVGPLRHFLFQSLDKPFSDELKAALESCVTIGAQLLMPDMAGRTEVLLSLLPSSREELNAMSRGKRTQLEIILRSLESSDGMPLLLQMARDATDGEKLTRDFLTALLFAWENLDELRNLTHALLKQAMLHLAAQIDKQVRTVNSLLKTSGK